MVYYLGLKWIRGLLVGLRARPEGPVKPLSSEIAQMVEQVLGNTFYLGS